MSIRVRCTGCGKKVSVDDAFAGGACRCPYCREIVLVGGEPPQSGSARPYAPVERPETPEEAPPRPPGALIAEVFQVPLANPVRVQGVVTVILVGAIVAMAAGAVWLGMALSRWQGTDGNTAPAMSPPPATRPSPSHAAGRGRASAPTTAPSVASRPVPASGRPSPQATRPQGPPVEGGDVAGIAITAPVVYVLDGGGSMKYVFDYARCMARLSILSLGERGRFNMALAGEDGVTFLAEAYRAGGKGGDAAARDFLATSPVGSADLAEALEAAIAKDPRTIVLFSREGAPRAAERAAQAKAAGVKIVAIALASDAAAREGLSQLAGQTGGRCQAFSYADLANWAQKAPPLD